MSFITIGLVSLFTGIFASLGLGGGMILIIYLTLFTQSGQLEAQGINIIFFLPIAVLSLIMHTKNGLVEWKTVFPAILSGCVSALIFSFIAENTNSGLLSKGFAIFLIGAGVREIFKKEKKKACSD